jgi:5-methyltetrahydrofolate--homocysteine methyltransferase
MSAGGKTAAVMVIRRGRYQAILAQPAAPDLYDALTLLDESMAGELLQARGVYGFWPAHADGDDVVVTDGPRTPMLRQQAARNDDRPRRCLADYLAPAGDHLGACAVRISGAEELAARYAAEHDDYRSVTVKALADRPAEACAEYVYLLARRDWCGPGAAPSLAELHAGRFRGIRPAFGYPAGPDHSGKRKLVDLLGAERLDIALTEAFALTPAASVSGPLSAHPAARYFAVGRLGADQVADYAARRCVPLAEAERRLRPRPGLRTGDHRLAAPGTR